MTEEVIESTGKELLEATQEAVIGAVSDVSNIIKSTTEEISGFHHEAFYQSPEFWVGAAFVLVVVALFIPLKKVLHSILQKRIESVVETIKEAASLRDEARSLLADYEEKTENLNEITDKILKKAQKEADSFKQRELAKFKSELLAQEKYTEGIINAYRDKIIAESSLEIINKTSEILNRAIRENLSEQAKKDLIDKSIERIGNLRVP